MPPPKPSGIGSTTRLAPVLRNRLLLMLLAATIPLGAISLWAVTGAQDNARTLLRSRLDAELSQTERQVARVWTGLRSNLLTLGENESVRVLLTDSAAAPVAPPFVTTAFAQMTAIDQVVVRDRRDRVRLRLDAPGLALAQRPVDRSESSAARFGVPVRVPLTDLVSGDTIGSLDAIVRLTTLVPAAMQPVSPDGPLLAVSTGRAGTLYPTSVDTSLFVDESVVWERERWTTVRRALAEPQLTLALAGALSPYEQPFEVAARRNTIALLLAFVTIVAFSAVYVRRLAREVGEEFAQREALATVGEFASELAHEVRNPLTAMRLDVQRADECIEQPDELRGILQRVLAQITRLDRAVSGALRVSRGASVQLSSLDVRRVLEAARFSADPEFARRDAALTLSLPATPLTVTGDADALEQLFLNLLLNAAQALPPGGRAQVHATSSGDALTVEIRDEGVGMTPSQLQDAGLTRRSARRDGNGLGLKVARRIVETHGGELTITSQFGHGTTVRVRLPVGVTVV